GSYRRRHPRSSTWSDRMTPSGQGSETNDAKYLMIHLLHIILQLYFSYVFILGCARKCGFLCHLLPLRPLAADRVNRTKPSPARSPTLPASPSRGRPSTPSPRTSSRGRQSPRLTS